MFEGKVGRRAANRNHLSNIYGKGWGDAKASYRPDIRQHRLQFDVAVEEVPAAWPDDDVERDRGEPLRRLDHAPAWCEPTFEERRAELDPIGPGALCGNEAVGVLDADFDRDQFQAALAGREVRGALAGGWAFGLRPSPMAFASS